MAKENRVKTVAPADKERQKGQVIIKGVLDPRKGDELVVGVIFGIPSRLFTHATEVERDRFFCNTKAIAPMLKGFYGREHFVLWEDGSKTQRFSGSGPAPEYPAPDRPAVRFVADPLPETEVDYGKKK